MRLAPVMLDQDLRRWRLLVLAAREAAAKPRVKSVAKGLELAAGCAWRAVMPDQQEDTRRLCRALCGMARTWRAMDLATRLLNADALRQLATRMAVKLGDEAAPPEPPPAAAAARLPYADDTLDEDAA